MRKNPAHVQWMVVAPLERLRDLPVLGWTVSAFWAVVNYFHQDVFGGALLLVMAAGAIDYYLGRKVAKAQGTYDPQRAWNGAVSKVTGIALLLLLRLFEHWVGHHAGAEGFGFDSHGMLSTAVAVSLFLVDLESVMHHREALGARPIPVLSALVKRLHDWSQTLTRILGGNGQEK